MARTALTPIAAPGGYAAALTAITWTAADVANGNAFTLTGGEMILVNNTDAASHNVTLTSVNDPYGRSGTVTEAVAAGVYKMFGPAKILGWQQSDGKFYLSADHAGVKFAIIRQ
jgi:hypothetical protein